MVAIESRKQAASRPRPPLPRPASGSWSRSSIHAAAMLVEPLRHHRVEHEVHDVVGERPADQELDRNVVDPLRVLAPIGQPLWQPALGQDVANRARGGLETIANARRVRRDDVVGLEMPLVEGVGRARETLRAAAVTPKNLGLLARLMLRPFPCHASLRHRSPSLIVETVSPVPTWSPQKPRGGPRLGLQTLSPPVEATLRTAWPPAPPPQTQSLISGMSSP